MGIEGIASVAPPLTSGKFKDFVSNLLALFVEPLLACGAFCHFVFGGVIGHVAVTVDSDIDNLVGIFSCLPVIWKHAKDDS